MSYVAQGLRHNTSKAGGREEALPCGGQGGRAEAGGDRSRDRRLNWTAAQCGGKAAGLMRGGERRKRTLKGNPWIRSAFPAIGDLLDSDGGGLSRSDVSGMCRRACPTIGSLAKRVMLRWRIHLPPATIPHIANYTPNYTPNLNLKNAPMPAAKAANTNGGIPLRRSRRKAGTVEEDSTIADTTKPRKRSNPEQAGTVEEDSTIADTTKPRTRSNTKATTVPAAPKPFKKPARRAKGAGRSVPAGDGNGAGDEEEAPRGRSRKRATATATEDPAPRPLPRPRPRTLDAREDTADTQPDAPSLDSASADPFSMWRRPGNPQYQPPLVPLGLRGLRVDLTGEEGPSLDMFSIPAVVCVKREPEIDNLDIDLTGKEDLLEENPFASGSPRAQSAGPHSRVASPDQTRPPSRSHTVDAPRHYPATPPQRPAPPAPPAPAPAPAAPAPQPAPAPAPAPEPAPPTPAPAPPAPPAPAPDPPAHPPSPARSHRSSPSSEPSDSDDDYKRTEAEKKMMREKQRARNIPVDDPSDDDSEQDEQEFADDDVAMEIFKEEEGAGSKRGKGKAASKAKSSSVKSKAPAGKTSKTATAAGTSKAGAAARKSRKAKAKQAAEVGPTDADIAFEAAIASEDEDEEADDDGHPSGAKKRGPIPADTRRCVLDLTRPTLPKSKRLPPTLGLPPRYCTSLSAQPSRNRVKPQRGTCGKPSMRTNTPKQKKTRQKKKARTKTRQSRDAFVEACGDIDPKDTAAVLAHVPELAEWRKILVEKAVADARNKGTLRTKIQTEMKPAIQILHMLLESYNVYGFGYIIDTDGDASFLFGAGENFKEMRGTHNLALKRNVKDYEHIFGEIERRKRGQPALPPVALITREEASKRDIYRQDFSRILAGQLCSKLIASVDRFAHAADLLPNPDPKSFRMLWNVKFLDMVWRCRCRIENYPDKLEEQSFIIGLSTADSRIIRESTYHDFMPALQEANSGRATANVGPDDGEYLISPSCATIDVAFVDEKELLPEEQGEVPLVSTADSVLFYVRDSPAWQKTIGSAAKVAQRRGKGKGKEKEKERKAASPSPSRFRSPSPPARYPSPRPSVPPQRPPPNPSCRVDSREYPDERLDRPHFADPSDRLYPSDNGRWLDTAPPAEPQRYYPGPGLHDDRAYADNRATPPAAEPPRYYPGPGRERLVLYDRRPERDPRRHDDRFVYDHRPRDDRFVYDDRVVYRLPRDDRDDRRPHDDRFVYDRRPRDDRCPHDDRLVYDRRPHDDRDDRHPHDDRSSREERDRAKPTRVDDGEVAKPVKRARVNDGEAAGPSNKRQHTMESQEQATEAVQQQTEKPGEALPFPGRGVPVPGALPWPGPYRLCFWVKTNDTQEPRGSPDFYASHFVGTDQSTTADRCTYAFDPDGSWTSIPEWSTPAFASPGDEELLANFWPFSPFSFIAHKSNLPFWEAGVEFPIWTHRRNVEVRESELPFWDAGVQLPFWDAGVELLFWEMQRKLLSFEGREVTYLRNQNTTMKLEVVVPPKT
ncbi:hypothetical protein B0H16DRAFT_1483860 [Mycena metata]|uniref:Uncharacterized protein n=1 Tax=Mycena metata TaxID=1033252 RepID=A0AAD7DVY8_9AGAR|nr:hypothetical protein B0H16DRAFT_1483860 [Mycena metata]